jgi:hypothetical protein
MKIFDISLIKIPLIVLQWSNWIEWNRMLLDARIDPSGVSIPEKSGMYEAKLVNIEERLTIGKASNLRMRIKQGLVKGKVPHSSGKDIRYFENTSKILIRWAITDRPSAVEEELHKQYYSFYGKLPKYTDRT